MKKYCFIIILLFSVTGFGQTLNKLDEAKTAIDLYLGIPRNPNYANKLFEAKAAIDMFLSDPKNANVAAAYYYKGKIYNYVSRDGAWVRGADNTPTSTFHQTDPEGSGKLRMQAFEAFKRYRQLDPNEPLALADQYLSYFDLEAGFFILGTKEFERKEYARAFDAFKSSLAVVEFTVSSKGYESAPLKFLAFNPALLLNIAVTAEMSKGEAAAVPYHRRLADANVSGDTYLKVYQFLTDYYRKQNDSARLTAIIAQARALYPQDPYWGDADIANVANSGGKAEIMAKYEELMKKHPTEFLYPYNLSIELYNQIYKADSRPENAADLQDKLTRTLKFAIPLDKGVDAKVLMAQHLFNYAYDLQKASQEIKGTGPEDVNKRKELNDQLMGKISECIPYAEGATAYFAALPSLTAPQKADYKEMLDILSQSYRTKGDLNKAGEFAKKKAELDRM